MLGKIRFEMPNENNYYKVVYKKNRKNSVQEESENYILLGYDKIDSDWTF